MRSLKILEEHPKTITWYINESCNFNCFYCPCWQTERSEDAEPIDLKKLESALDFLDEGWRFCITGGEPFLEKNFLEICRLITKKHYLSCLLTNLSNANVEEFSSIARPDKCLFIDASLHITEREKTDKRLSSFIEKVLFLQKKGFHIVTTYVAHPELLHRMADDIDFLKSKGINEVRVKNFGGWHNDKQYPASYSAKEKKFLKSMNLADLEDTLLKHRFNFHGRLCSAGYSFFVMDRKGNLRRCSSSLEKYGNFFDRAILFDKKPKACNVTSYFCSHDCINRSMPTWSEWIKGKIKNRLK